ncbi:MAG TPA: hypothetical protein VGE01_01785, partial [Fimbriimonas sp.]
KDAPTVAEVGGTPSLDIITLKGVSPAAPLRFGNVIPGSERVTLGTRTLVAGQDYKLDGPAGVVYLAIAVKPGDSLTVYYRYKPGADPNAARQFAGVPTQRFSLVPGGLSMLMGFGQTERTADGRVLSTNIFGFNSNLKFAGGNVKGLLLFGQRERNEVAGGLSMRAQDKPGDAAADEGDSKLILQNYSTKMLGGEASFDYQDVSSNFTAFNQALESGYDQATVDRLRNERGMTRFGMAFKDLKFGGLGFSNSFRNIKDDAGSIEWRTYGLKTGGLSLNYSSQKVDEGFTKFATIGEANREQLAKERGMSRQNLSGEFAQKAGALKFGATSISDDVTGNSIERREVSLDTSQVKFALGDQKVSQGFTRFDHILPDEKAKYGLEAGLKRQWMSLQTSMFGTATPLSFKQNIIQSPTGDYRAQDFSLSGKTWSLNHAVRASDNGFNSTGAMTADEANGHLAAIANMYGPGTPWRPDQRAMLTIPTGISREYTSVQSSLFKDWNFAISELKLKGLTDEGLVQTAALQGKNFKANYRKQELGKQFNEVAGLLEFERQRLGSIAGLERTDLSMNFALGGSKNLAVSTLEAKAGEGGLRRASLAFTDKKIDVTVNSRSVDPTMALANQLVDPEKDMLQALQGFRQQDIRVKWQLMPQLKADLFQYTASNGTTAEDRELKHMLLDWTPNDKTYLGYVKMEQHAQDPIAKLFANVIERITFRRDFGRLGKLQFMNETVQFDGKNTTEPDRHTQYLAYETKLDQKTSIKTEQTRTNYDNGQKEEVSANTVSTALTTKAGVSVTDLKINRTGEDRDETKRNYGFWYDIGNGLRLSYGYARHLNGLTAGEYHSTLGIGTNAGAQTAEQVNTLQQGKVGDMLVAGGYGVNAWDADGRTQSFSNVRLNTAKPINLGFVKNATLAFSYDTAADYSAWLRENRLVSISGQLFGRYAFGYEYKSQMTPTGDRGIDRTVRFETPQSPKNWLYASIFYKARTLPWDEEVMIRDIKLAVKPSEKFELSHRLSTNPEVAKGDALLGSITAADRLSEWALTWNKSPNQSWSGSWREYINDQSTQLTRTGGLTLKLNESKGSPLTVYYGVETLDGTVARKVTQRYSLQYDQKPGPNQVFSFFVGNVSYDHTWDQGIDRNNITLRLDYQFRF